MRRDVERLRRLGYPVEATPGADGGYRLAAGASLPPLLLDDEEATAIAVGLRTAASSSVGGVEEASLRALVKLEQVLPAPLRRRVSALSDATATIATGGPTVDAEALTLIAMACRNNEVLTFGYTRRDGAESRRRVEPDSLVNFGSRWYLVGWDRDRLDWRIFRVDRLNDAAAEGGHFTARTLPGVDAAALVSAGISAAPQRYEALVTLHAPLEEVRDRVPPRWGKLERIDERSCSYRTGDYDLNWLSLRIAMLGVDFEIHKPTELRDHVRDLGGRLLRGASRC